MSDWRNLAHVLGGLTKTGAPLPIPLLARKQIKTVLAIRVGLVEIQLGHC